MWHKDVAVDGYGKMSHFTTQLMAQMGPGNVYRIPRLHETYNYLQYPLCGNTIHAQVLVGVQVP